jgi:rubrerythrin
MSGQNVCYTFEAALEMAIKMENDGFRHYLEAIRKVLNKGAREILKEAALDELGHKHHLEKALVEGYMITPEEMTRPVPTMNLDYVLAKKELSLDSDAREALIYAIHLEKVSIDFYKRMTEGCAGAPMASLFERLLADESRHLQALEDMYEEHYLPEN